MARPPDYLEMAQARSREDFIASCPFPFLVGDSPLIRPAGPQRTIQLQSLDQMAMMRPDLAKATGTKSTERAVVLAVRKVQDAFPNMITIGRTPNNDVVLSDVQISKFHAFFRHGGGKMELVDAGSRNGTWVRKAAVGKEGIQVYPGDAVRFARLEFIFFDAAGCWSAIQRLHRYASNA